MRGREGDGGIEGGRERERERVTYRHENPAHLQEADGMHPLSHSWQARAAEQLHLLLFP